MEQEQKPPVPEEKIMQLQGAKQVMNKVEQGDFSGGNVNKEKLQQDTKNAVPQGDLPPQQTQPGLTESLGAAGAGGGASRAHYSDFDKNTLEEKVKNTNFPDEVKQAMIEEPVEQVDPMAEKTFSVEDVERVIGKQQQNQQQSQQQLNETPSSGGASKQPINEAEIKNIVNKELMENIFSIKKYIKEEIEDDINDIIREEVKKQIKNLVKRKNTKKTRKPAS